MRPMKKGGRAGLFHHVRFLTADALKTALHECIHWYNTERISTKLEGQAGGIPRPSPCGLGSYLASPTIGDQFTQGARPSPSDLPPVRGGLPQLGRVS